MKLIQTELFPEFHWGEIPTETTSARGTKLKKEPSNKGEIDIKPDCKITITISIPSIETSPKEKTA